MPSWVRSAALAVLCGSVRGMQSGRARCEPETYGAKADGVTKDTAAIQQAINACAGAVGGSVVYLKSGTYLSGALWLKSHMTLKLSSNATLKAVDPDDWKSTWEDFPATYVPDVQQTHGEMPHAALLNGGRCLKVNSSAVGYGDHCLEWETLEDVTIQGSSNSSIIDGNGAAWHEMCGHRTTWQCPDGTAEKWGRPRLIHMMKVKRLTLRGFTAKDAAFWTIVPQYSENVEIWNVDVKAAHSSHNTDGFNIQSCKNVNLMESSADVADDCIAVYSGGNKQGQAIDRKTENVYVHRFLCRHGHGLSVGSRTAAPIKNITFKTVFLDSTTCGPRIKTCKGRGGEIYGITYDDIWMHNVTKAFEVTSNYMVDNDYPEIENAGNPKIAGVMIRNVGGYAQSWGSLDGLVEEPVWHLTFKNITLKVNAPKEDVNSTHLLVNMDTVKAVGIPSNIPYLNLGRPDSDPWATPGGQELMRERKEAREVDERHAAERKRKIKDLRIAKKKAALQKQAEMRQAQVLENKRNRAAGTRSHLATMPTMVKTQAKAAETKAHSAVDIIAAATASQRIASEQHAESQKMGTWR